MAPVGKVNFFTRVPLWVQIAIAFASFALAQFAAEIVAVWSTTGRLSSFFVDGLRIARWKPDLVLSDGRFAVFPVDLFILLPLWIDLSFGSIATLGRLRRGHATHVVIATICLAVAALGLLDHLQRPRL
jgi:hypothetical protein